MASSPTMTNFKADRKRLGRCSRAAPALSTFRSRWCPSLGQPKRRCEAALCRSLLRWVQVPRLNSRPAPSSCSAFAPSLGGIAYGGLGTRWGEFLMMPRNSGRLVGGAIALKDQADLPLVWAAISLSRYPMARIAAATSAIHSFPKSLMSLYKTS